MTIDFENESSTALDLDLYEIAQDVVSCALDYMECPYEAQVSILITDNDEIHRILSLIHILQSVFRAVR